MEKQGLTPEEKNKEFITAYTEDFWNTQNIDAFGSIMPRDSLSTLPVKTRILNGLKEYVRLTSPPSRTFILRPTFLFAEGIK